VACLGEATLFFVAAAISFKAGGPNDTNAAMLDGVLASTAIAMGLRNAVVRKLGVADRTSTVLTLTIAGLAADSALAGAAAGSALLRFSLTVPLLVCGAIAMVCAFASLIGLVLSFVIGDIPTASSPVIPGELIVLAMTLGYTSMDRLVANKNPTAVATTKHLCGGPTRTAGDGES
jgi:hypothetical protein